MSNELRAVVYPQMGGGWILSEEFLNGSNHIHRLTSSADTNRQADVAVLIENIMEFQSAAIHSLIKLKNNRPYMGTPAKARSTAAQLVSAIETR